MWTVGHVFARVRLDLDAGSLNAESMGLSQAMIALRRVLNDGDVCTDRDVLEACSGDASEVPNVIPEAVVYPRSTEQVAAVMRVCHDARLPVVIRGGGTGKVGGAVPTPGSVVLHMGKLAAETVVEPENLLARTFAGTITSALHSAVEAHGLFFPPDPSSLDSCTIGGNVATNAGGPRAFKYGVTREYVLGATVVTGDGTVHRLGRNTRKGVVGYDLTSLMVGSEGTLGVITDVTLRLVPLPERVCTLLVFLPDAKAVEKAVTATVASGVMPRCVELLDSLTLSLAVSHGAGFKVPTGAEAMLVVELDGPAHQLDHDLERAGQAMMDAGAIDIMVARHSGDREKLWQIRRDMSHALRRSHAFKMSEDVAVPRSQLARLLEACRRISADTGITMPAYGHAGDGNLHVNFLWDDPAQAAQVQTAIAALMEATVAMGGTLSGEHGIGVLKAAYLPLEQSEALRALQESVKTLFDPAGILNPGKIWRPRS